MVIKSSPLNREGKYPLYIQLYEIIKERIKQGQWQAGEMLPTETELMEQYQVSRITIRQVFNKLVHEGLVNRERGRGTFMAHPTIESNLVRIKSFTEDMLQRGLTPQTVMLSAGTVLAAPEIADKLHIEPEEPLAHLRRLRFANQEPISIEESYLVTRYCPNILNQHDYANYSLRKALEEEHGIRLVRAQQTIKAVAASKQLSELLMVQPKSPLLFIERVSFSQYNIPIEFLCVYYRADRYVLYNELQG